MTIRRGLLAVFCVAAVGCDGWLRSTDPQKDEEICDNRIDDDGDGAVDCVDADCTSVTVCAGRIEDCDNGTDDDLDGNVDCVDADCAGALVCSEDCGDGADNDGDGDADCDDSECHGVDPRCGEVCGDGDDNDGDGDTDCNDPDCYDVIPPCGGGQTADGTMCAYSGAEPHLCACADGQDNDGDGQTDGGDLQCFGPFDDDEASYATGIPGDNNGSKGDLECPFDGNSGPGNDGVCCNPANPEENVTPNGCDANACCEVDVNGNGTGEHVYVIDQCVVAPDCGSDGKHGCPCVDVDSCDAGQFCVADDDHDAGDRFCSWCESCVPDVECENPCSCGEICFGGFEQPAEECSGIGGGGCPTDVEECPGGVSECSGTTDECVNGCCYPACPEGVTPCRTFEDCGGGGYYCITGCCIIVPV